MLGLFGNQAKFGRTTQMPQSSVQNSDQGWNRNPLRAFAQMQGQQPQVSQAPMRDSDKGWNSNAIQNFSRMNGQQQPMQMPMQQAQQGLGQFLGQQQHNPYSAIINALLRR